MEAQSPRGPGEKTRKPLLGLQLSKIPSTEFPGLAWGSPGAVLHLCHHLFLVPPLFLQADGVQLCSEVHQVPWEPPSTLTWGPQTLFFANWG
jgi:hypothetical protein